MNGSTMRMSQDDHKTSPKLLNRELDAANLGRSDNISCDANHKQVSKALIKYDFSRYARIRTSDYDCDWTLPR
jgi:hypothetical protein